MAGDEGFDLGFQPTRLPWSPGKGGDCHWQSRSNPITQSHAKSPPDGELLAWLGIKNDYRTLIDLESVNVVKKTDVDDEAAGNESLAFFAAV